MEGDAKGAFLARPILVLIRNAGRVLVAVMTDRSFEFFQRHAQEPLELGKVAGRKGCGACLMPGRHQTAEEKKEGAQNAHCRPAASSATEGSCTLRALYTSLLQLSNAHSLPPSDWTNNVRPCELVHQVLIRREFRMPRCCTLLMS